MEPRANGVDEKKGREPLDEIAFNRGNLRTSEFGLTELKNEEWKSRVCMQREEIRRDKVCVAGRNDDFCIWRPNDRDPTRKAMVE